jgi:hypothetical protein
MIGVSDLKKRIGLNQIKQGHYFPVFKKKDRAERVKGS